MEAADERKVGHLIQFSFCTWLKKTFTELNLGDLLIEKLTERLPLFDPEESRLVFGRTINNWQGNGMTSQSKSTNYTLLW
jgi:hypothetical protein